MELRAGKIMNKAEAKLLNPLQLAYMGDTVWEILVRQELVFKKKNVNHMHHDCVSAVNAKAQAESLETVLPILSDEEMDIVRRGRNAHARHPAPKNQDPGNYAGATGFEALFGYLYLTGQEERACALFQLIMQEEH